MSMLVAIMRTCGLQLRRQDPVAMKVGHPNHALAAYISSIVLACDWPLILGGLHASSGSCGHEGGHLCHAPAMLCMQKQHRVGM